MTSQLHAILNTLFDPPETPACEACQDVLPAYVDTELNEDDPVLAFPRVHAHLSDCASCLHAHEELKTLLQMERSDALAQPPQPGEFNFSYLETSNEQPAPASQTSFWRLDELGKLIIELTDDLLQSLQMPSLQPSYLKHTPGSPKQLLLLGMSSEIDDIAVTINAEENQHDPTLCAMTVKVDIFSRDGWPNLAGTEVTVGKGVTVITTESTDAFGHALFQGILVDDLPCLNIVVNTHRSE